MLTIQLTTCNPSCDEKAIASKGLKHFEALKQCLQSILNEKLQLKLQPKATTKLQLKPVENAITKE